VERRIVDWLEPMVSRFRMIFEYPFPSIVKAFLRTAAAGLQAPFVSEELGLSFEHDERERRPTTVTENKFFIEDIVLQ